MRVISGTWSGRVLRGAAHLRPTQDRVREALFSMLGGEVSGVFLDLFAGAGTVGIEAASRGASSILVDRDELSVEVLRQNVESLGSPDSLQVFHQDALAFAKHPPAGVEGELEYLFMDPPYAYPAMEKLLRAMSASALVGESTLVILEHETSLKPGRRAPGLKLERREEYGETTLSFYRKVPAPGTVATSSGPD